MSRAYIPKALRDRVAAQAKHRCGYCLTPSRIVGALLEIEHLVPESLGGPTEEENLWLACSPCNGHKGNRIAAIDPLTEKNVPLFDPRRQLWVEHFAWTSSGERIVALTATGRATVTALRLNRPSLVLARREWVSVGWHPPKD
ncbi:MAG TPA: HNH endonuclease signature motif containing protein [Thermoanaerobaculia bacterium]|nr:HNH endonuclease signature motif containing protein [Thermoanaerobaculia bacterium]